MTPQYFVGGSEHFRETSCFQFQGQTDQGDVVIEKMMINLIHRRGRGDKT
jgi:hypothetical protein